MARPEQSTRQALLVAGCGLALALAWQCVLVYGIYGGARSGLFYTGADVALPPAVEAEAPVRAPDPVGFDGQYYHVVAHDPLLRGEPAAYVDNPRLRWRRILVPGLAYGLALGRDGWVDAAFVVVLLAFTFVGLFWSARYAERCVFPAWLGLAFLLLPATFVSLERMTVDVALAALCVGFAALGKEDKRLGFYVLLAAAPLARETGLALAGAWALARRSGKAMAFTCLAAVPFACWALYVHSRTPSDATSWFGAIPLGGLVLRTLNPLPDAAPSLGLVLAGALEYLAVWGVWAALALTVLELRRNPREPLALASGLTLAVFAFLAKEDIWLHAYGFARTLSPALLLLALLGLRERRAVLALPWALTAPRIVFQAALLLKTAIFG